MISAFTKGYKITQNHKYREAAVNCCSFILNNLWNNEENTLYHRYRDGDVKFRATLDDYAFLTKALIDLYEITFEEYYLMMAIKISEVSIDKFYDKENSGFYDTEQTAKDIILKTKDIYDGAEPSGNSIIIESLIRLGYITGEDRFKNIAENSIKYFYPETENSHFSSPQMLNNILLNKVTPKEIIFTGDLANKDLYDLIKYIHGKFIPFMIFVHASKNMEKYSNYIKDVIKNYDDVKVYICKNQTCNLPVSNLEDLKKIL
jgi:hypothetical protein